MGIFRASLHRSRHLVPAHADAPSACDQLRLLLRIITASLSDSRIWLSSTLVRLGAHLRLRIVCRVDGVMHRAVPEAGIDAERWYWPSLFASAPPHSGYSGDQPRHEPGSVGGAVRPSLTEHDPGPCAYRVLRARGVTSKPVERSHIPTRDRLRNSRRRKTIATA